MLILVINAGSSSIKFSVFCERESDLQLMLHGEFDGMNREPQLIVKNAHGATVEDRKWSGADTPSYDVATEKLLELVREHLDGAAIDAVGHRVVHGGDVFSAPTLVSDEVLRALEQLVPGVLLYLMDELKMDARALEELIYQRSGLLGVSGLSSDMRVLVNSDLPDARLAVDLFVYRIGRELGSLAAALGGGDAIVFTAGIGEHQPSIRARVCEQARWLGVELDEAANASAGPRISTPDSAASVWVIATDEELMIARHTRFALSAG